VGYSIALAIILAAQIVSLGLVVYWFHGTKWRRIALVLGVASIIVGAFRRTALVAISIQDEGSLPAQTLQDLIALAVLTVLLFTGIVVVRLMFQSLERSSEALREKEARFRNMVENLPGLAYRCLNDETRTMLYATNAMETLTGFPVSDFLESRRTFAGLVIPEDRAILAGIQDKVKARETFEIRYRLRRASGDLVWVYERGRGVFDDHGNLLFLNGFISDITDRVRAEQLLQAGHDLALSLGQSKGLNQTLELCLRAAIDISDMDAGGIYLVEPSDGSIQMACHAGLPEWFVQEAGYYPGDSFNAKLIREGQALYTNYKGPSLLPDTVGRREGFKAIAIIPIKYGDSVVAGINIASRVLDSVPEFAKVGLETLAGQIGHAIVRDRAQMTLQEREANLTTLFSSIPDMLFVLDENRVILRTNQAVMDILGYGAAELANKPFADLEPAQSRENTDAILNEVLSSKQKVYDSVLCARDGREIPVGTSIVTGFWNGHPAFFCVSRDITERLQTEATRLSLERQVQLARKLESLGILAGGVAHDFNNLLTVILGNAELVLNFLEDEHPGRKRLELIMQTARHASELCRQMMTYSGRGPLVTEVVYPNGFLEGIRPLLSTVVADHLWLEMHVEEGLPPILGDPAQLRQVMLNLVLNASDAVGEGLGNISITARLQECREEDWEHAVLVPAGETGHYVVIEVADTGCGMDEETQKRLFDPFYSTKSSGRGLGMTAVLGIMRAHNGAIEVISEPGRGSLFRMYLQALDEAEVTAVQEQRTPYGTMRRRGDSILFVDDELPLHDMCKAAGEDEGFKVLTAANGVEALERYMEHGDSLRLVVLDMTMPVMDGAEAFRELRRIDPGVRVLIASGYSTTDYEREFAGENLVGVLHKPYSLEDLRRVFNRLAAPGPGA